MNCAKQTEELKVRKSHRKICFRPEGSLRFIKRPGNLPPVCPGVPVHDGNRPWVEILRSVLGDGPSCHMDPEGFAKPVIGSSLDRTVPVDLVSEVFELRSQVLWF